MRAVEVARITGFVDRGTFFQFDLALTAIAATGTAITDVVRARVLGARGADTRRFFPTNTTIERHD